MDIKGNGLEVRVNPADQSDEWLLTAAQEIHEAAQARGLELPKAVGVVALEQTVSLEKPATTSGDTVAAPDTKESLAEQLISAGKGYQSVANLLNSERRKDLVPMITDEVLATEFDTWFSEDKLAYITAAQEADPELRFTLVATPNVLATSKEIIKAAELFGQNQPYETYVWDELYGKYNASELSRTNPNNGNAVIFSLIPSKLDEKLYGTVAQQRMALVELQKTNPSLKAPSVLEAVTYWNTLRVQNGDKLPASDTNFDRTFIRHFDLPEKRIDRWARVPYSCVYDVGKPYFAYSGAENDSVARVSVG